MKKYSYLIPFIIGIYISPLCLAEYDIVVMLEGDDDRVKANQLIEGSDGALYGTNEKGGELGGGSIFKINKDGSGYQVLHSFSIDPDDGAKPLDQVIEGSDGILYGTTASGGKNGLGTIFKINKDGTNYAIVLEFSIENIGFYPATSLLEGSDGVLYGTTSTCSVVSPCLKKPKGNPSIFKINKDGTGFTNLIFFKDNVNMGTRPASRLIEGSDGYLYGTGNTRLFKVSKDGSDVRLLKTQSEVGGTKGALISDNGVLYAATRSGGSANAGSVFKMKEDGTDFKVLRSFVNNAKFPHSPQSGLVLDDTNGVLHGVASNIAYQLNTDGTDFTILTEGILSTSTRAPMLASDGAVYGTLTFNGHCEVGLVRGIYSLKNSVETIFNWAETNFPQHFPTKEVTQVSAPWSFRYYPATNIYLGINNDDNGVYVLGGTFGGSPLRIDSRESIVNQAIGVNAVLCEN